MGRSSSALILAVVALALGGYLYFFESKRPVEVEAAKVKVFSYDAAKINQLQIKSSGGEVTVLKKGTDDVWTIVQPTEAAADRTAVSTIVTSVANLEEQRVVEENAADLAPWGLREPRVSVTFHVDGEKEPRTLLVGDQTPGSTSMYAKVPAGNRVFLVPSSLDSTFDKSTFALRDKTVLTAEQAKVDWLELASPTQNIRLEKSGENWKMTKPVQAPADFVTVSAMLGQLQSVQMTELVEKPEDLKNLTQYGLDKPAVVATVGMGSSTAKIELGKMADPGTVWARTSSHPGVFKVLNGIHTELTKGFEDVRQKEIFAFRPYEAARFEITRGQQTRAFERVKGTGENPVDTWKQVLPVEKEIDSSNFSGALLDLSNLRAQSFVSQAGAATGHDRPAATILIKFMDAKKPDERVVIGSAAGGVFATRPDQPGAMKIEDGKYGEAIKKLDAIQ